MFNNPVLQKLASGQQIPLATESAIPQESKKISREKAAQIALKVVAVVLVVIALIAAFKISIPVGCAALLVLALAMAGIMLAHYLQRHLEEREQKKSDIHNGIQQRAPIMHYQTKTPYKSEQNGDNRSLDSVTFVELKSDKV